jgi:hypothetical protein
MNHLDVPELLRQVLSEIDETPEGFIDRLIALTDAPRDRVEAIKSAIREASR